MNRKIHLMTLLALGIFSIAEAFSQSKKEREIVIISNGDTIIHEKSPHVLYWDDKGSGRFRYDMNGDSLRFHFGPDSLFRGFNFRIDGLDSIHNGVFEKKFRQFFPRDQRPFNAPGNEERMYFPSLGLKKNSAQFNYRYVDQDGIEDNISVSLNDATSDQRDQITGSKGETPKLEIKEITLFPDYMGGGLNLTFRTATSGNTGIRLLDSSFKELFTDNDIIVNSAYLKSVPITRNGVYYLAISQAGRWYVKRIIRQ